jgi:hypothetical protein
MKLATGVNFINILSTFFAPMFLRQKLQSQIVTKEKLSKALLHEKGACKMLMKLTTGINFINILCPSFVPIFLRQKIAKPKCN